MPRTLFLSSPTLFSIDSPWWMIVPFTREKDDVTKTGMLYAMAHSIERGFIFAP
jgi:hypothetical protein